jgi:serine acetyltransferase
MEDDTDSDVRRSNPQTINTLMLQPPKALHTSVSYSFNRFLRSHLRRLIATLFSQKTTSVIGCTLQTNTITCISTAMTASYTFI